MIVQTIGHDGTALHPYQVALLLQGGQVVADRHGGRAQLGGQTGDEYLTLRLQLFQDLASSDIDLQHGRHSVAPLPYYI